MTKPAPIKHRIAAAIRSNHGRIKYYDLARAVFPENHFPKAWGRPARGGPPGCYMALSRAIREHRFHIEYTTDVVHSIVSMGSASIAKEDQHDPR